MHPAFPPDPAPLDVDRVEWLPASPQVLRVHLLGRWGERPISGSPLLLVGDVSGRHGFSAIADPPAGVLIAFEVPNELRAALERDIALQLGSLEMALPPAVAGSIEDDDDATAEVIDRAVLAERRARRAELSEDTVARRAETAERTIATLTAQLANLEQRLGLINDERAELEAQVAGSERRLRAAEQREHAEQQLRIEAQEDLGLVRRAHEAESADLRERLESVTRRAEELAHDVERTRRATAEAVQRGEADRSALRRAEAALKEVGDETPSLIELRAQAEELGTALAGERVERERLEQLLEQSRASAKSELKRLEYELAGRREVHAGILAELAAAHAELQRLRAHGTPSPPAVAVTAPVAAVDPGLEQRIAALEQRRETAPHETSLLREVFETRTHELERARLELRQQLLDVITGLRDAADSDRASRVELDRQMLARERRETELQRLVADVLRTSASLRTRFEVEIRELEKRMTERLVSERAEAAEKLEVAQRQIADLQARVLTADEVRSGRDLTLRLRAEAESLRAELARVRALAESQAAAGEAKPAEAVIGGLAAAASRLREQTPMLDDDEFPGEPSLARLPPKPVAPVEPPTIATHSEPTAEQATPAPLATRRLGASAEPVSWLAPAIARMALRDEDAAGRLMLALLPALRPAGLELAFELKLEELGSHRVVIGKDATSVEEIDASAPGKAVDFRLSGPTKALAALIGGGMRRRPKELRVSGRRRRFRKLAKQHQRPIALADVRSAGVGIDPGLLLTALASGVEPEWTIGHGFTVVWKVSGGHAGIWHTDVRSGEAPAIVSGMPADRPTAIVYVTGGGLIPLLGDLELPAGDAASVVGDAAAVTLLREWFDRVQGLA